MVQISSKGYNVAKIGITGTLEQDTDTIIGTAADFDTIARFAKTGYMVLRCKYAEGAETLMFDGSVDCEINEDGSIFISTLTDNGAENDEDKKFYAITGVIYKSEGNCYMNLSEDEISGSSGGGTDEYVSVNNAGGETIRQLIEKLYPLIDGTKVTTKSRCEIITSSSEHKIIPVIDIASSGYRCGGLYTSGNASLTFIAFRVTSNSPIRTYEMKADAVNITDISSDTSFTSVRFYY